ncbi:hypothetical protein BABINDRAFT_161777 [Babjeviella inositovora NRRL Y-12698]|uniref:DNA repair protein rad9 n=1 Tax=Babjeviella inositovora NRRL Y-12698 TaxID=984486 RepID=A0A1E3QNW8_9ASCO|nr:uncharacterized protein BABINDRAFT_161777 [Babjeviella inositovora NRRL Y-12698]ODQ79371.1 hypothetical protein BABINDRAFT_161777 [Babjeviella inositovora NRRL Y-12698]
MSFLAVIENCHKQMWARSLAALATISESIMFSVSEKGMALSAINLTQTSYAEIQFDRSFFKKYDMSFVGASGAPGVDSGFETENKLPSFNFTVYAKNLCIVFKKLDTEIDYLLLQVEFRSSRLRCEIKGKNLIRRQYSWFFTPVQNSFTLNVQRLYRDRYANQKELGVPSSREMIHYIKMEPAFPKHFLDLIPPSTEDFRLELTTPSGGLHGAKLSLYGFTKAVMKEREYLKQPMSTTMATGLEGLMDHNCNQWLETGSETGAELSPASATFRLKDFKTFMSICIAPLGTKGGTSAAELSPNSAENYLEVLFTSVPGNPILFETQKLSKVTVAFVLITDGERGLLPKTYTPVIPVAPAVTIEQAMYSATQIQRNVGKIHQARPYVIEPNNLVVPTDPDTRSSIGDTDNHRNMVSNYHESHALFVPEDASQEGAASLTQRPVDAPLEIAPVPSTRSTGPQILATIGWDETPVSVPSTRDESFIQTPLHLRARGKAKKGETLPEPPKPKAPKRRLLTPEVEEPLADSLGPTQHVKKPRGLFD